MDIDDRLARRDAGRTIRYELGRMASVDDVLAEARRLRAQELDRLLRALGHSLWQIAFGGIRSDGARRQERHASLAAYIRALRLDGQAAQANL